MKRLFIVLLHCGYWLMYFLLIGIVFATVSNQLTKTQAAPAFLMVLPILLLYVIPNVVSFYGFYLWVFPKYLLKRQFIQVVGFGTIVCLAAVFLTLGFSTIQFGLSQPILNDSREFLNFAIPSFLIATVHGTIALVIRGFVTWFDEMKIKEELSRKNVEMELALIKSQMNPHFLFNTLNNIDVLIGKDPAKASDYLQKLSRILRYMVYETGAAAIPLTSEIENIQRYIELQRIRSTNPDYVRFETGGEMGNRQIAPMVLFPFIENAFKHAENNRVSDSIIIRLFAAPDGIVFECLNRYPADRRSSDFGGLGDQLMRGRLNLLYPAKHTLTIGDSDNQYRVKLEIDDD